ncbi:hypothetical protein F511_22258 [Dorcoceras hygrometricum]|uniref:Splicing factor 3B subunit 1-like n=1 Tax=Dorcoceras hygrometricum TaxID=472368 RepID=A0A2Z7CP80_9LAMI|nr:hypothetical protein F511_22258 [Dorcoceras hygrometricum]
MQCNPITKLRFYRSSVFNILIVIVTVLRMSSHSTPPPEPRRPAAPPPRKIAAAAHDAARNSAPQRRNVARQLPARTRSSGAKRLPTSPSSCAAQQRHERRDIAAPARGGDAQRCSSGRPDRAKWCATIGQPSRIASTSLVRPARRSRAFVCARKWGAAAHGGGRRFQLHDSAVTPPVPKCKASKRKLKLPKGSDDEDPDVVITEIEQMGIDFVEPVVTRSAEIDIDGYEHSIAANDEDDNLDGAENQIARKMASKATNSADTEPLIKALELTEKSSLSDEESMSIDDILKRIPDEMILPSVTAEEPTKLKFVLGIEIKGVKETEWYTASLPKIAADAKGKKPLEEPNTIKGHPARESFKLICGDIHF